MWRQGEGTAVVERLAVAVAPHGCRLVLVGSVATRGFSDKDMDVEIHVDGERDALERVLAAIDSIRHTRHLLVCHLDNQVMFVDAAFRPLEVWLHMPAGFWHQARELTNAVWWRVRADKIKAVASIRRARKNGRPAGFEHVSLEVFKRERERLAAYISPKCQVLVETRRVAKGVMAGARS